VGVVGAVVVGAGGAQQSGGVGGEPAVVGVGGGQVGDLAPAGGGVAALDDAAAVAGDQQGPQSGGDGADLLGHAQGHAGGVGDDAGQGAVAQQPGDLGVGQRTGPAGGGGAVVVADGCGRDGHGDLRADPVLGGGGSGA